MSNLARLPLSPRRAPLPSVKHANAIVTTVAAFLLAGAAHEARAGGYIALDGSSVTLGEAFDDDLNPRGGRLRLGVRVSEAFDVELHAGVSSDTETGAFDSFDASWAGAYLKGYVPIGERSALFALGGIAGVELAQSVRGADVADERGGFSWGMGLETSLTERLDLSADWMRYVADEGAFERVDAVSLGLKLYFR